MDSSKHLLLIYRLTIFYYKYLLYAYYIWLIYILTVYPGQVKNVLYIYIYVISSDHHKKLMGRTLLLSHSQMRKPRQRVQGPIQGHLASKPGGLALSPCS